MNSFAPRQAVSPLVRFSIHSHRIVYSSKRQPVHLTTSKRRLHNTVRRKAIKPFLLADIGEGIREVQVIQWFIKAEDRVEQFDPLCEVQSDKATVEITSRFDGVVKKLHYAADEMAIVGKPLVDIDIQNQISPEDEVLIEPSTGETCATPSRSDKLDVEDTATAKRMELEKSTMQEDDEIAKKSSGKHATLSTPAVRHLTKQLGVEISDVKGTGKDGRVLKEDVHNHASTRTASKEPLTNTTSASKARDETQLLSAMQMQMFKTMTRSLAIPHFLYTDAIDMTNLDAIRRSINAKIEIPESKISALAFILKAASLVISEFPIINARLDTTTESARPRIIYRNSHNFGIAVDTPQGLIVPVIKDIQSNSISNIAAEIIRLSTSARQNKLSNADLSSGTFSVSNVGSIGGCAVAPVIVDTQVAILGIGRTKAVPAFNAEGQVVRREECIFSWSADHRIVDGATLARCAEMVKGYVENPAKMLANMR